MLFSKKLKIKYNKKTLGLNMFLMLVLLLNYHFLYIIPYPNFLDALLKGNKYFVLIGIAGIILASYCIQFKKNVIANESKKIITVFFVYLICWGVEVFYSLIKYNQDINSVLGAGGRLLLLTYAIPFFVVFIYEGGTEKFWERINVITLIWSVLIICQSLIYAKQGMIIFDFGTYFRENTGEEVKLLNGSIRMTMFSFGNLMIIYNFDKVYMTKSSLRSKIWHIICLSVGIYSLIIVQQTRVYTIVVVICFVTIILIKGKSWKDKLLKIIILILCWLFLLNSSFVSDLIRSFSITGENRWSTQARLYAVMYYVDCIKQSPIFGNGFLSEIQYYTKIHGTTGQAQYSDVGILGLFAETGIFSIVFFIVPVYFIIKSIIILKREKILMSLDVVVFVYVIATSATLILTVGRYCYTFAFILAYYAYRISNKAKKI